MKLEANRRTDLAIRALIELESGEQRRKSAELADLLGTSQSFMSQAVAPLVHRGWVESDPGPSGGYRLVAAPEQLSLLDVIEELEGPIDDGRCISSDVACSDNGGCSLHQIWCRVRIHLITELSHTTIADLAAGQPSDVAAPPTGVTQP